MIRFQDPDERPDPCHFQDPDAPQRTLCGQEWHGSIVWRNDLRADCVRCQDEWAKRTGWAFPLPELVV